MIHALFHGKLSREQENMEDVLTSNVFGLLRYLPANEGLLAFLAHAETVSGSRPLGQLLNSQYTAVEYQFWPFLEEVGCLGCEPDLLIRVRPEQGPTLLVLVEAKYLSGKSSLPDMNDPRPVDQLAREWDNLQVKASQARAECVLVYVTTSYDCPRHAIQESIHEYNCKRPDRPFPQMLWLSWRRLSELSGVTAIHADLRQFVRRLGLTYFNGFPAAQPASSTMWTFERAFGWTAFPTLIQWSFKP